MSERKKSKIRTTEIREMMLLNLKDLFENRCDFNFISDQSKYNKIFILNEFSEVKHKNAYPRIILHRNGSNYKRISGFNDSHEGDAVFEHNYSRADLNAHNFSLVVKDEGCLMTEQLGYIVSSFIRFFSKDLVFRKGYTPAHEINHFGLSSSSKVEGQDSERSAYQTVVSFEVVDNEIFCFEEEVKGKIFADLEVSIDMVEVNCYCESNNSCPVQGE